MTPAIHVTGKDPSRLQGDISVFFCREKKSGCPQYFNDQIKVLLERVYETGDFTGKEGRTFLHYPDPQENIFSTSRVLIAGLGSEPIGRDVIRKTAGSVVAAAQKTKSAQLIVFIPSLEDIAKAEIVECLTEGFILGNYQFRQYKTTDDPDEESSELRKIYLHTETGGGASKALKRGRYAAMAANFARDLANEPPNVLTPQRLAGEAEKIAGTCELSCKVLSGSELKRHKMGGILGVSQGSSQPPTMTILHYKTGIKVPLLMLVGKGLTFDSGGISLKPSAGMEEMKYDMAGAAAVLAAMQAIGEEKPRHLDVVAIIPAAENLPGPQALKPSDIITMYNGKTVEVVNTDAEGRLILADALAYGIDKYKPDAVIDLATLTGAVIVALGHHRTGLLSNDDQLAEKLYAAGERCAEPVWRLPLGKEYSKQLKSQVADLKNIGKDGGGSITAAAFLEEFIGPTKWAHLDIAGTAWSFTEKSYIPKGPSGTGARTLIELIRNWNIK